MELGEEWVEYPDSLRQSDWDGEFIFFSPLWIILFGLWVESGLVFVLLLLYLGFGSTALGRLLGCDGVQYVVGSYYKSVGFTVPRSHAVLDTDTTVQYSTVQCIV